MYKAEKYRDLTFIDINNNQTMVIACDSCGSIGDKENDIVKTDPETVGYFTLRVPLMEILAIGANPVTITNTLSVEMDNTGKGIIKGIQKALRPLNISDDIIITGSTEENFPASVTGIGITVIGMIDKDNWRKPETKAGNLIVVVGMPKVGQEVLEDKEQTILSPSIINELRTIKGIGEIVPAGSKGLIHEIKEISRMSNLKYTLKNNSIDIHKTAGPATCGIITLNKESFEEVRKVCNIPFSVIGEFY
ncbi:AIR synthase related protein [Sporosalibacterium faouarense]|uniref:AIR synthase related protein n=1 Tax=Sporosalibacterium faouarense TaxID=516123 RepID=UPI00192B4954|nr:AIR synthase related protein [Sporosalibacterium faouarense]